MCICIRNKNNARSYQVCKRDLTPEEEQKGIYIWRLDFNGPYELETLHKAKKKNP
jgi:hypothetical protein